MEDDIFWSEIGSGFGEPGGTPPPRILKSTSRDFGVDVIQSRSVTSAKQCRNPCTGPPANSIRFESPFNLIGKLTMAFLTGQSWPALKSLYSGGGPEQEFRCCFADGLNPLGLKSDHHQFSPNNISRSSRVKVMRITKLITKGRTL